MATDPFAPARRVADLFRGFDRPWFIAGGWAIDLLLDRATRLHEHVDVAILRRDQRALRSHLADWVLTKAIPGARGGLAPWSPDETLMPPIHEVHASPPDDGGERFEILLQESFVDEWRFRRNIAVTRPLDLLGARSPREIPILRPEIVLLFKAKRPREADELDFANVAPLLSAEARAWLREALVACHPGHRWAAQL